MKLNRYFITFVGLLTSLLTVSTAFAVSPPRSMQQRKLVYQGTTYVVSTGTYEPPFLVKPVKRVEAKYSTPEEAMVSHLSALITKDYDWFYDHWTDASRKVNEQRNKELNSTREQTIQDWSLIDNKPIEIRYRADYIVNNKKYVFISYRVKGMMIGDSELEAEMAFTKESNRWLATQDLASNPVLNNLFKIWKSNKTTVVIP